MRLKISVTAISVLLTGLAQAHDAAEHSSRATIIERGEIRIVEANGLPDHKTGSFPNRGNPNAIEEQRYRFEMPLKPKANDEPRPVVRFIFGVAINGVVFDPGTAEVWVPGARIQNRPGPGTRRPPGPPRDDAWNYDGMSSMNLGLDANHAHVQPNGAYHYHGLPKGLVERLQKDEGKPAMILVGYAADGFPIYAEFGHATPDDASSPLKKLEPSYRIKQGQRPKGSDGPGGKYDGTFVQDHEFVEGSGDLDKCNGRTGVTPEYPQGMYYYVLTESFPFVPRFFRGTPDKSFEKLRSPGGPGGRDRPPRRRP